MEHSITSLAKKARITVRTLRHYDQIGLLKPSIRMGSGKRIYNDEQAMRLFEIVFFKKVGISLPKIKELFLAKDCNKTIASALTMRKQALTKEIKKLQRHSANIDMVLPQYANCSLNQKERLEIFRSSLHAEKEIEDIQMKEFGKDFLENVQQKIEALSEEQVDEITDQYNKLMKAAVQAVEQGIEPSSKEALRIVKRYYDIQAKFYQITQEIFLKIRDAVLNQKELIKAYHPELPEFLYRAFDAFATEFFKNQSK